jgi:hypothetical protein
LNRSIEYAMSHSALRDLVLAAAVFAIAVGCEPPAASSAVANAPPGPPPLPAAPLPPPVPVTEEPASAEPTTIAASGQAEDSAGQSVPETGSTANDEQSPAAGTEPPEARAPEPTQVPTAGANSGQFISLSAGVAVPQLLPEGTQVGVSVDYSLRREPNASCRYFLVVESGAGAIEVPVKLEPRGGNFQGFLPPSVRPEHLPFRVRIDEVPPKGERVRVSNSAPLATSY